MVHVALIIKVDVRKVAGILKINAAKKGGLKENIMKVLLKKLAGPQICAIPQNEVL